jgi:hypothetical protein
MWRGNVKCHANTSNSSLSGFKRSTLWRFYAAVNTPYLGLHVKCHDISIPFELNLDLFDIFPLRLGHNISQKSVQSEQRDSWRQTVGRTAMTKRNGTSRDYANALKNILRNTIFNLPGSTKKDFRFASPKGRAGKNVWLKLWKNIKGLSMFPLTGRINSRHASVLADSVQTHLLWMTLPLWNETPTHSK